MYSYIPCRFLPYAPHPVWSFPELILHSIRLSHPGTAIPSQQHPRWSYARSEDISFFGSLNPFDLSLGLIARALGFEERKAFEVKEGKSLVGRAEILGLRCEMLDLSIGWAGRLSWQGVVMESWRWHFWKQCTTPAECIWLKYLYYSGISYADTSISTPVSRMRKARIPSLEVEVSDRGWRVPSPGLEKAQGWAKRHFIVQMKLFRTLSHIFRRKIHIRL